MSKSRTATAHRALPRGILFELDLSLTVGSLFLDYAISSDSAVDGCMASDWLRPVLGGRCFGVAITGKGDWRRIETSGQAANTALISAATCGPFSSSTKWPASSHTSFASGRSLR
jgi:hypothetical protein